MMLSALSDAAFVLWHLRQRGYVVRLDTGSIVIRPFSTLDDEDKDAIREHKAKIVELLGEETSYAGPHPPDLDPFATQPSQYQPWHVATEKANHV